MAMARVKSIADVENLGFQISFHGEPPREITDI